MTLTLSHFRHRSLCACLIACVLGRLCTLSTVRAGEPPAKGASTFYHAQARERAAANAKRYEWARKQVEEAVAAAEPFVNMSDDDVWRMAIPPKLKRAIDVNISKGCPACGMQMYGSKGPRPYAWLHTIPGKPWKVQCPNCKELFPKNDFAAFYESGIHPETGLFEPARGDRRLLFNTDHPDPADPKHTWGVDDGNGWQRTPGGLMERDWFIAYHAYFGRNGRVTHAIRSLSLAFALTGKPIYAHKATILLDRTADMFPDYNGANEQFFNNVWGHYSDGLVGPNYWDGAMWAQRAIDYDMIFDGMDLMPETLNFIRGQSKKYRVPLPKESVADIRGNIEQRILIDGGRHPARIDMNGTITEMCRARVDFVLRGQAAMNDFIEKQLPVIVPPQHLNEDGSGNERSTGYDGGAFGQYCELIEELGRLDLALARGAIERYPKLRAAFDFWFDVWCVDRYVPLIGDTGSDPGESGGPRGSAGAYLLMFELTGEARYAQGAMRIAGNPDRIPRNIFAEDSDKLIRRAESILSGKTIGPPPSVLKADYKLGIFHGGTDQSPYALWFFYSPQGGTSSHSHFDALNIGLYAFGVPLIPEQGYPLYTGGWPARWNWTSHTRSHATVTINGQCQKHCDGGRLLAFVESRADVPSAVTASGEKYPAARLISAEAPCAYDGLKRYRRSLVMVELSPERMFVVDVFRVAGAKRSEYVTPFYFGSLDTGSLKREPAGDLFDGYVSKVRTTRPAGSWQIDVTAHDKWQGQPVGKMRVYGAGDEIELFTGEGECRWGRDDPRRLPYLVLRKETATCDAEHTFVVIYEPLLNNTAPAPQPPSISTQADGVRVEWAGSPCVVVINDTGDDQVSAEVQIGSPKQQRVFRLQGKP